MAGRSDYYNHVFKEGPEMNMSSPEVTVIHISQFPGYLNFTHILIIAISLSIICWFYFWFAYQCFQELFHRYCRRFRRSNEDEEWQPDPEQVLVHSSNPDSEPSLNIPHHDSCNQDDEDDGTNSSQNERPSSPMNVQAEVHKMHTRQGTRKLSVQVVKPLTRSRKPALLKTLSDDRILGQKMRLRKNSKKSQPPEEQDKLPRSVQERHSSI